MKKICHLTSVHKDNDIRIFIKECTSLAPIYETYLIVAGSESKTINQVNIIGVDAYESRIKRAIFTSYRIYKKALDINAEIYHFHDPELIWVGWLLQKKGKKVVYDVHENVSKQIMGKYYIPIYLRKITSKLFGRAERFLASSFSGIITATPFIEEEFKKFHTNTITINNFPLWDEIKYADQIQGLSNQNNICYIGGITEIRGIKKLIEALSLTQEPVSLIMAGHFSPTSFKNELCLLEGWSKVQYVGHVSRTETIDIMSKSVAGIVPFLPLPNHIDAQPNKMFEYMSSGLPVLCSSFPLWENLIIKNNLGLSFNPESPKDIARVIDFCMSHKKELTEKGKKGKELVKSNYNWEVEKEKLISFYKNL